MENIERIETTINRVAPSVSPIGKDDPTALLTNEGYVYRETGYNQIQDIIDCGYVRSNAKRSSNQVWWTEGGVNSFHINKRPVLVARSSVVIDGKIGAINIEDLSEIWIYDEQLQRWINSINEVKNAYYQKHQEQYEISDKQR